MSTNAIVFKSESEPSSATKSDQAFGCRAGARVTRTEACATPSRCAICFAPSIGLIASAAPAASPPQMTKWVSGRLGKTNATGRSGATPQRGESVCGASDVPNEFRVGPNVRFFQAVGRHGKRKGPLRLGSAVALSSERRIGVRRQPTLRERDGFNGKDIGQVADRHDGPSSRHRQDAPASRRCSSSASIFFSRGLSLRAVFRTPSSRRGVSLASMKSSGRSGPH